jgi:hypothetical protein
MIHHKLHRYKFLFRSHKKKQNEVKKQEQDQNTWIRIQLSTQIYYLEVQ